MALLLTTLIVFSTYSLCACTPDYAVQPCPIEFTEEPQTQTVPEGSNVTLHCNFNVTKLGSNYPLPHIVWRKNGTEVLQTVRDAYSELHLQSVQLEDEGYYECLAVDGKRRFYPQKVGRYITSSRRAYLTVLVSDVMEAGSGVKSLVALAREPLLVPCQASTDSTRVLWYQNGTVINTDDILGTEILNNGSLLLLSPHVGHSGSYECISWLGNQIVHQQYTDVDISEDAYSGPPQVFVDSADTMVMTGDTLNITCYVGGVTRNTSSLRLLREGVVITATTLKIAGYANHRFSVTELSPEPFGHYMCELLLDGNRSYFSSTLRVTEESYTTLSQDEAIHSESVSLACDDGGSIFSSVYWYKNGQELDEFANSTHLEMSAEHMDNLTGVYQCFGQRSSGVSSNTTRVFSFFFSNPPTNLKCGVQFSPINPPWPLVTMNWGHPDYVAVGVVEEYIVTAAYGLNIREVVGNTSAEVDLSGIDNYETTEELYVVFVAAYRRNRGNPTSAPARCIIRTVDRALDPPLPIEASCPDSAGTPVQFKWTNPLHESNFNVPVSDLDFAAKCIYGNQSYSISEGYDYYDYTDVESTYTITIDYIPNGAVCIAAGTYELDHESIEINEVITIPQKACSTPPSVQDLPISLGLSCALGVVEMTWNTSLDTFFCIDNITLHTKCATMQLSEEVFFAGPVNFSGREMVYNISSDAMCTFYGWYTDTCTGRQEEIPPAQCYMDQPSNRTFYPPVIVPDATLYSTYKLSSTVLIPPLPTTSTPGPSPRPSQTLDTATTCFNQPCIALWILTAFLLIIFCSLVVLLVVIIFCCKKIHTYNKVNLQDSNLKDMKQ